MKKAQRKMNKKIERMKIQGDQVRLRKNKKMLKNKHILKMPLKMNKPPRMNR